MKRQHIFLFGGLLLFFIGMFIVLRITQPEILSWSEQEQSAETETAFDRITIAITRDDINRLPERFVEYIAADHPPLELADAATASIDALLISRETLVEVSMNTESRAMLDALLDNHKILLVYGATTGDLQQAFDEPLSTIQTRKTETVFASLDRLRGVAATGQVVVSDDHGPISVGGFYGYVDRSLQNAERFSPYPE